MDPSTPQYYKCSYGRIQLLSTDNYADWSTSIANFLKADRTWRIVQGIEKEPTRPISENGSSSSTTVPPSN